MLEVFSNLNREMERTGMFTIRKEHLFRLVAQNNILITEIITKLGLLERSDTAWKYAQYGPIWDGLRSEFELDARFQTMDLKVSPPAPAELHWTSIAIRPPPEIRHRSLVGQPGIGSALISSEGL